jgi:A/G-specific adenine glycosylase
LGVLLHFAMGPACREELNIKHTKALLSATRRSVRKYRDIMPQGPDLSEFRERLLGWFRQFQRDLPWRRTKDAYRIWLSEIMLQQTRVAAVIPYYKRFLEQFPSVQALSEAPEEDVLRWWSGLGYYSRARNLQAAAKEIVLKHGGEFPRDPEEALALPGIGPYTVAAILSIAYGRKLAVLDGNVARVVARIAAVRGDLRENGPWHVLQGIADDLLDRKAPSDWNQAMMELGATLCTPRAPQCLLCPVTKHCRARQLGIADMLPEKRKKRATVEITLAAAVLLDPKGRTVLLPPPRAARTDATDREIAVLVSKMWHFPIISVESDATAELRQLLMKLLTPAERDRELRLEPLAKARHAVTYRAITLLSYRLRVPKLPRVPGAKSILLSDVVSPSSLAVSNLTRKAARAALAESMALAAVGD